MGVEERQRRILVVSGRLLVAQSIVSLLEDAPGIEQVDVENNLYDALVYCRHSPPDALVIDLPSGADYFVDRPVVADGPRAGGEIRPQGWSDQRARV